MTVPQRLNRSLSHDPEISLLGIYSQNWNYIYTETYIWMCILYYLWHQRNRNSILFIHWWLMNKQNVVYPYNGILFRHKTKWSTDLCYEIDESWKYCACMKKVRHKKSHVEGVWGRMDTCVCTTESLSCLPETITTLLIGHITIQNKKFNKNKTNKNTKVHM